MVVLFLFNCAPVHGETPAQVSTLDELIRMFDSSSCKECHEKIYEQWEKSHHSRSLMGIDDQMLLPPLLKRIAKPGIPLEQLVKSDFPVFQVSFPPSQIRNGCSGARDRRGLTQE